jgi:hypothetical protein
VEFTKLMALLSAILTILSLAAYVALTLAWGLREIDCNSACAALPTCVPAAHPSRVFAMHSSRAALPKDPARLHHSVCYPGCELVKFRSATAMVILARLCSQTSRSRSATLWTCA